MSDPSKPANQRDFRCNHCNGKIMIPWDLPPTTGPCPHCGGIITSPALPSTLPPAPTLPMPVAGAVEPPVRPAPLPVSMPSPVPVAPPATIPLPVTSSPVENQTSPVSHIPAPRSTPQPVPVEAPPATTVRSEPARQRAQPAISEEPPAVPLRAQGALVPPQETKGAPTGEKKIGSENSTPNKMSILVPLITILLLLVAIGAVIFYLVLKAQSKTLTPAPSIKPQVHAPSPKSNAQPQSPVTEAQYLRIGWQKDASETLQKFMSAQTAVEKLPFIINGDQLAQKVDAFYGGTRINDSDTPAETFSAFELSDEDKKRGIFMMSYDQPPQFAMKEFFRPLAPLEVQYGLREADLLLSTVALVENFAMEPLRVHAFFKRTPSGMKLDWETFVQTKYRTFETFVGLPEPGLKSVFRVLILEDVPEQGHGEQGTRTYRLIDPANKSDTQRVDVKVDSDIGRTLSPLNWRGTQETRPNTKTATVELAWTGSANNPQLELSRFICWEFLGLGGESTAATVAPK